jgi:pilus assembly protein CpaC
MMNSPERGGRCRPRLPLPWLFALVITALIVVWPGWLRTTQAGSWVSEEGGGVRHVVVTLNKSRTLRLDKPFASAVVGAPDIIDALPMSDRVLYIQGKKVGTTNVSVFDQSMKLIGVLDVEIAIDTGSLQNKIRSVTGSRGIRVRSSNGQIVLGGVAGNAVAGERAVAAGSGQDRRR